MLLSKWIIDLRQIDRYMYFTSQPMNIQTTWETNKNTIWTRYILGSLLKHNKHTNIKCLISKLKKQKKTSNSLRIKMRQLSHTIKTVKHRSEDAFHYRKYEIIWASSDQPLLVIQGQPFRPWWQRDGPQSIFCQWKHGNNHD